MSEIFQRLLKARGLKPEFLELKYENLSAPEELPDMEKAVKRIMSAKKLKEKILIYGDYDVDGVTATATVFEALKLMGCKDVAMMLPDRFIDGYGMSKRLVSRAEEMGAGLVITVDCGSNNGEIIEELAEAGIDTVVTDHHEIMGEVPKEAVAVVNPKRAGFRKKAEEDEELSGLLELAGAGVAFMLAKALTNAGAIPEGQEKWLLDLTVLGTICDSMRLTGENRTLCHFGMIVLEKTRRPGLKALIRAARTKRINTEAIGFQLGPRLNAAGRMETAELSLKLLTTQSKTEAERLASELNRLNAERRAQQTQAVAEIERKGVTKEPVMVVSGEWHEGVLGIIAGRLTERYKKPSFVLTKIDGEYKGSGRSFGDFNLALALAKCDDILISGGGHAAAAGVKLPSEKLEEFTQRINEYYKSLKLEGQERFLEAKEDIAVESLGELNLDFIEEMRKLEPFGEGNPEPVFLLPKMMVMEAAAMGAAGQHLRLSLRDREGKTLKIVAFNAEKTWMQVNPGEKVNAWVELTENEWNGIRSVEGRLLRLEYSEEY